MFFSVFTTKKVPTSLRHKAPHYFHTQKIFSLITLLLPFSPPPTTYENPSIQHENPSIHKPSKPSNLALQLCLQSFKSHSDQQNRESGFGMMGGSSKKLGEIIEKWRKRKKGHFVVYTKEGKRFVVPLYYLNHPIFKVLLEMAEEEFGSMVHGPLQVPCEEELMDYILSSLRKNASPEVENALVSMASCKGASVSSLLHSHEGEQDTVVL